MFDAKNQSMSNRQIGLDGALLVKLGRAEGRASRSALPPTADDLRKVQSDPEVTPSAPFQGAEPVPESNRKPERVWIARAIV